MNAYPISFWQETAGPVAPRAAVEGEVEADVAVIGAGLCGLSTAFYLKREQPGLRVVVLEADVCGYGASGRGSGVVKSPFGLRMHYTKLRFGAEAVREGFDFMTRAVEHVGELVERHGVDCDYERTELMIVATSPAGVRRLRSEYELARRVGIEDTYLLDAPEARRRLDSKTYLAARVERSCVMINPAKLVREFARLAEAEGAVIYEQTPAASVEPEGERGPVVVETPRGRVRASKVVFATNGYARLFPQLASKQLPIGTYVVLTEPLTAAQLASLGWEGREAIEDSPKLMTYYRLTPDNRLLMGGGDVVIRPGREMPPPHAPEVFADIERHMLKTFPSLSGVRVTHRWGGPLSVTLDMAPAFGWLGGDRRVAYGFGCIGHGLGMMAYSGQLMRDLVLERKTALTELFFVNRTLIPWPPEPLRFALAQGMRRYMQLEYNDAQRHIRENSDAPAETRAAGARNVKATGVE
ncbi:MAG TPA: FAD-binding oxidoreductase [Pyrinomonadaceae bacterium]|jgi:glycine/D-amino acid oxidase-like deaminating enzyme|nr:FAD-binding oxidoreductase [Pyrinomonadaceae bacterium]